MLMGLGNGASVPMHAGSRGKSRVASLKSDAQVPPNGAPGFPGPTLSQCCFFSFKLNTSIYELLCMTVSCPEISDVSGPLLLVSG